MRSAVRAALGMAMLATAGLASAAYRPVVLMHGLMASSEAMSHIQQWVEADFPGIYVHNVEVGNGKSDSLFMDINKQVEAFAATVKADPKLAQGFNLIGHSQGGLITRAYVHRFNDPPVHNLISLAGPHAGQYGVPDFNLPFLDKIMSEIDEGAWAGVIQDTISFAAYWKDPYNMTVYERVNHFLADINNEKDAKNGTYKANLASLNTLCLQYSEVDTIVIPKESPTFAFFAPGQSTTVTPMKQTPGYQGDWIGLRTLDEAGKVQVHALNCSHQNIPRASCQWAYNAFTRPLLNNSI